MSERASLTFGIVVATLIALGTIGFSEQVVAQTSCQGGQIPATEADIPAMKAAGISNATVGECWNPNDANIGQAAAQAKQDLSSMTCGSGVDISNLDGKFAVCADTFMKALRQQSPGACIRSAYRSPQQQLAACMSICGASSCPGTCAPPGYSYHQKGLAIDVNYKISNSQAWQIAVSSTNSGVINPNGLHGSDPSHFQANSASCAGSPVQQLVPTDYYSSTSNSQTFFTPTNANQQIPSGYCLVNTQPILYAQCSAPQTQATPLTTATLPTSQTTQSSSVTSPTVTQTSPLTATATASSVFSNPLQTQSLNLFPTSTPATTVFNIITNLSSSSANPSLNPDLNTIVQIRPGMQNADEQPTSTDESSQLTVQQTFDVSDANSSWNMQSNSTLSQVLNSLSGILTNLLSYLRSL